MKKIFFLFSLTLITHSLYTFDSLSDSSQEKQLRPWVVAASIIYVRTLKEEIKVEITDTATVFDVKNKLYVSEGLPIVMQQLVASYRSPWTLWLKEHMSPELENNRLIKQIMAEYNTDIFRLYITMHQNRKVIAMPGDRVQGSIKNFQNASFSNWELM